MNKKHIKYAEQYASYTVLQFIDHPEYRGVNFTWQKLPDMVKGLATVSAFTSFPNIKESEENEIGEHAKKICENMLRERNLI